MELHSTSVALLRCDEYDQQALAHAFDRMWLSCRSPANLRSSHVLLKPNLISARQGLLACTEGRFILAAAGWFIDRGAYVTVGDSPAFGTTASVLHRIGITGELRRLGVDIVNFKRTRETMLPSGVRAALAVEALDCDLLVNLPRVKAHIQVRVSMAVKNYFGCLAGMHKPLWHMIHGGTTGKFESLIVEFLSVLPESITLVDGITAMHQTGPMGGKPFALGLTACSANPVAIDRALLEVIGIAPVDSPVMQACRSAGLNGSRLDQLIFTLQAPDQLKADSFEVPRELSPVRFNPFRFIKNGFRRLLLRINAGA